MPDDLRYRVEIESDYANAGASRVLDDAARIKQATVDANKQMASADQEAASASRDLTAAQAETAEGSEALQAAIQAQRANMVQWIFQAHRTMEGLKDISEGGRLASQGFVDLEETLGRFLPPMAQVGLALVSGAALLAMMATRHRGSAAAAKEHADAEKDAAEETQKAWSAADEGLKQSLDELKKDSTYGDLFRDAKRFTDELDVQETSLRVIQAALDRLADAKFGAQEALLNKQEQQDLKGKTGEEAEEIKLQYEQKLDSLRSGYDREKAQRELDQKQAELIDLQGQLSAAKKERDAANQDIQKAATATSGGTTRAALGESDFEYARNQIAAIQAQQSAGQAPLTSDQYIELQALQSDVERLRQQQLQKGPQYTEQIERYKALRETLKKQETSKIESVQPTLLSPTGGIEPLPGESSEDTVARASSAIAADYQQKIGQVDAMIIAMTKTQEGGATVQKLIDDSIKAQQEFEKRKEQLDGKITAARTDIQTAQVNVESAGTKSDAQSDKDANALGRNQQEVLKKVRDDKLKAQMDKVEAQLEKAPVGGQDGFQKQLAELKKREVENKRDDDLGESLALPAAAPLPKPASATSPATAPVFVTPDTARDLPKPNAPVDESLFERPASTDLPKPNKPFDTSKPLNEQASPVPEASAPASKPEVAPVAPTAEELLRSAIRDLAQAEEQKVDADAGVKIARDDSREVKATKAADKKEDSSVASQAEAVIDTYGPSKTEAKAAHDAVRELDKGNAAGAAELIQILSQISSTAKSASAAQTKWRQQVMSELQSLKDAFASMKSTHQS